MSNLSNVKMLCRNLQSIEIIALSMVLQGTETIRELNVALSKIHTRFVIVISKHNSGNSHSERISPFKSYFV